MKKIMYLVAGIWLLVFLMLSQASSVYAITTILYPDQICIDPNGDRVPDSECDGTKGYVCQVGTNLQFPKAGYCKKNNNQNSQSTSPTDFTKVFGKIQAPEQLSGLGIGSAGLSNFLSRIITIIYSVAAVAFVFMVVYSAVQLILSGGDKEKIGQARSRLTYAIIGIILLALAFVIIRVIGTLTGFNLFQLRVGGPPAAVQYLRAGQTCQTGTTTLGQCDNLSGYYCRPSGQGEIYTCQTVTNIQGFTPTPSPNPLNRLPCEQGEC